MTVDIDHASMERAYAKWAPIYDVLCGPFFWTGRKAAAELARASGRDILEIGVGTGLSFGDYGPENTVTGIDASYEMIRKACNRASFGAFPHVKALRVMDAHRLQFEDNAFDVAVGQFVITLVERPETVLDECVRVLRPGGSIILVNHLYSETGLTAWLERTLAGKARQVGLRPDFPFARFQEWANQRKDVRIVQRKSLRPFGWFTLVQILKL